MTNLDPGWVGPRDPQEPGLNIGDIDGHVTNCTDHDMGDCPFHAAPKAASQELTDAEKLAALGTYLKVLGKTEESLRAAVAEDMGRRRVEKVGAFLPDGTKMASVSRVNGRKTAKVTDMSAALQWCLHAYPDEIVHAINPAFLKKITDWNVQTGQVGEAGVDPITGEVLPFIEVQQGSAYVSITTTAEGRERMTALAHGFAGMLEGPHIA